MDAWAALAAEREPVAGGTGLHLPGAAVLLANAVWDPDPGELAAAAAWCAARTIPEAIVLPAFDRAIQRAARAAGFEATMAFVPAPLRAPAPRATDRRSDTTSDLPDDGSRLHIEQIGFARAGDLGLVLARQYRQPDQAVPIGHALADALRRDATLAAWLAWRTEASAARDRAPDAGPLAGGLLAHAPLDRPDVAWSGLLLAGGPPTRRWLRARLAESAAAAGRKAVAWQARTPHGSLPANGRIRFEREPET